MGGEWLKMRVDLWDDPRVVRISSALDADKARTCGALFRTWALADQYTIDGRLVGYTPATLDAAVGIVGWSQALEQVGWLTSDAESVQIPRFTEHNGQSAKRRASERDRKKRVRNLSAGDADTKRPRKEKREVRSESKKGKSAPAKPASQPKYDPLSAEIPAVLNTPEFRAAWADWCAHRREIRKTLTPTATAQQLAELESWGVDRAVAAIAHTIARGWQGIREPDRATPGNGRRQMTDDELFSGVFDDES